MRCPNCGNENPADYVFCDECGARLQNVGGAAAEGAGTPAATLTSAPIGGDSSGSQHSGGLGSSSSAGEISAIGSAGGATSSGNLGSASGFDSADLNSGTIAGADTANNSGSFSSSGDNGSTSEYSMPAGSASAGEPMAQSGSGSEDTDGSQASGASSGHTHEDSLIPSYDANPLQSQDDHASMGHSGAGGGDSSPTPSTEDTVASAPSDTDNSAATQDDAGTDQGDTSMPGVVPMVGSYSDSESSSTSSGMGTSGGMTSSGTSAGGGGGSSAALTYLNNAEQAISQGDWSGFGQAMHNLRSYLQSQGSSSTGAGMQSPSMGSTSPASDMGAGSGSAGSGLSSAGTSDSFGNSSGSYTSGTSGTLGTMGTSGSMGGVGASGTSGTSSSDSDLSGMGMSAGGGMASGPMPAGMTSGPMPSDMSSGSMSSGVASMPSGPMSGDSGMQSGPMSGSGSDAGSMSGGDSGVATLEPAAEAGTLGSEAAPQTPEAEVTMARLVMIATGAELPLPDQEEILVGREDPSSGIFPDIDLTPYGGEDGGVSRRHSRLLHIGDDYFVEDLQSTNYTKLDGQRLPAHVRERLEDGARLDFGRVATIFRRS